MPEEAFTERDYYLSGQPGPGARLSESFPRDQISTDLVASIATGVMTSVAILLSQGDIITNLSFLSGATPASVPLHSWFALYSSAATPALLQQTADQLTGAWAADTVITLALAAPVVIATTGVYYASVMVVATTVPTLMGKTTARASAAGAIVAGQVILARTSGSALTTTAPATITGGATLATMPYCVAT
ncbi:MAG: hypothetical protein ACREQ5_15160 [Candidatus Dormibacteria bacterium]